MAEIHKTFPLDKVIHIEKSCLFFDPNIPQSSDQIKSSKDDQIKSSKDSIRVDLNSNQLDIIDNVDLSKVPCDILIKTLPTDTRKWLRDAKEVFNQLRSTKSDNKLINRSWLLRELLIFPIHDVLDMSNDDFGDNFIMRLHNSHSKDDLFEFMVTAFGYAYQDEINRLLNSYNDLLTGTLKYYLEVICDNSGDKIDQGPSTSQPKQNKFQEFSMLYVKPSTSSLSGNILENVAGSSSTPKVSYYFFYYLFI